MIQKNGGLVQKVTPDRDSRKGFSRGLERERNYESHASNRGGKGEIPICNGRKASDVKVSGPKSERKAKILKTLLKNHGLRTTGPKR